MESTNTNNGWTWSQPHGKYYRYQVDAAGNYVVDQAGQYILIWAEQPPTHVRSDSVSAYDPNMAPAAPESIREALLVRGTPDRGWYEQLDSSYRVRTRAEEYQFFKQGRVFATLWTETAGETTRSSATENSRATRFNPAITQGRFGQGVYSQIRRFVIVKVNRNSHFVLACGITTYGDRGVLKPGCKASEHTIVHLEGTQPIYLRGEFERGMTKTPIRIRPTDSNEEMKPASRLRLGKVMSIECNVKVKDIGMVVTEDRSKLLEYFQEEQDNGFEADDDDTDTPQPSHATIAYGGYPPNPNYYAGQQQ